RSVSSWLVSVLSCPPLSPLFSYPLSLPPGLHTLSLHAALPILLLHPAHALFLDVAGDDAGERPAQVRGQLGRLAAMVQVQAGHRSEEHTSELQSRFDLVCRLLLEIKKQTSSRGRQAPALV